MAVAQNECYRVVTIGYLKNFIKDGNESLIKDSNGNSVNILREDDTYCPTYSELTGGTIVQTWKQGSTSPRSDRDGIAVSSSATLGGSYADNQLVNQKDVTLKYTRFGTLSISANKTSGLSQCGESVALTTTYNYTRYTKAMSNCPASTPITYDTSSSSVNGPCSDLTWHTSFNGLSNSGSSVSNCNTYTIGKNGAKQAAARCDYVSATTTFRTSSKASSKLKMCQNALTGSYSEEVSGSSRKVYTELACTPSPSSRKVYGVFDSTNCTSTVNSGVTIAGMAYYDEYKTFAWKENVCGTVYWDDTEERKVTSRGSESAGSTSHTFNFTNECCEGGKTVTKKLTLSYQGMSCNRTFTAITEDCSSEDCCGEPPCCKIIGASSIGCSGQVQYKVVDCGEPETCSYIVVDGAKNYNKTSWNDSCRITSEGRFTAEVYDNIPSGIINSEDDLRNESKLEQAMNSGTMWMLPYSTGRTGSISSSGLTLSVDIDFKGDADWWSHSPCVAAQLQWRAGLMTEPECVGHHCQWDCWIPGTSNYPCDSICQTQPYITGDTNLGYANYNVTSTGASGNRLIVIYWYPEGGEETYKMCPSRRNICYLPQ